MRHIILALTFTLMVAALLILSGCGKVSAPADKTTAVGEAIESTEVEVTQASEDLVELEKELDIDEVDLEIASLFADY
ncbi:MAG: hypothetical protein KAT43_03235 [Nanoarchaeota archaeon]|nr:hypothetical protein [Nanoarchaeota archaeon]